MEKLRFSKVHAFKAATTLGFAMGLSGVGKGFYDTHQANVSAKNTYPQSEEQKQLFSWHALYTDGEGNVLFDESKLPQTGEYITTGNEQISEAQRLEQINAKESKILSSDQQIGPIILPISEFHSDIALGVSGIGLIVFASSGWGVAIDRRSKKGLGSSHNSQETDASEPLIAE